MKFHQDHFIALTDTRPNNPGTVPTNIVPSCGICNDSKGNKNAAEWLIAKFGKRRAYAILKRIEIYFEWVKEQNS